MSNCLLVVVGRSLTGPNAMGVFPLVYFQLSGKMGKLLRGFSIPLGFRPLAIKSGRPECGKRRDIPWSKF